LRRAKPFGGPALKRNNGTRFFCARVLDVPGAQRPDFVTGVYHAASFDDEDSSGRFTTPFPKHEHFVIFGERDALERFPAKQLPVRVKKTRKNKELES
jgi:hypothetical protein